MKIDISPEAGHTIRELGVCVAVVIVMVVCCRCAGPQLPRNEAERAAYCAQIERTRGDVARLSDDMARAAFTAQLNEQAEAGRCKR